MQRLKRTFLLAGATTFAASAASGQTFISDNFEVDSSANYTVVDLPVVDGVTDFNYDYVAAGIPLAPRSVAGDTTGLRLTCNDTLGAPNARTLFHNTVVNEDIYRLTVDVWMNWNLIGGGTTEFAHVGVGGDGVTPNSVFTPIEGSGSFLSFSGDGGVISDHRWFRAVPNTPPGDPYNTTIPNDDPSYMGNGSDGGGFGAAFWEGLFPSPPATVAGSPGNIWTTVTIDVDNIAGTIKFSYDGTLALDGTFAGRFDGLTSLGIKDAFASLSTADNFTIFDNLTVEGNAPPMVMVGTAFCPSNVNSTGVGAEIAAFGSEVATDNNLTLVASDLPALQFGIFVVSPTTGAPVQPANSGGLLCLSGPVGRYNQAGQILQADSAGEYSLTLDLTQIPTPTAFVPAQAGDTYNFQSWFRDSGTGSNFTSGVAVTFQ